MPDRLSRRIRNDLRGMEESGMGYWVVRAELEDGRIFRNVIINGSYQFGDPTKVPFRLGDISRVLWDGYRGSHPSMVPIPVRSVGEDVSRELDDHS
jgi:hypothetical protein